MTVEDKKMRALGFTDRLPERWYFCASVGPAGSSTTLNLTLEKSSGAWTEYVLDEDFGQPEYYGNLKPEYRDAVVRDIDRILQKMQDAGLPFEVDHRAYGVTDER